MADAGAPTPAAAAAAVPAAAADDFESSEGEEPPNQRPRLNGEVSEGEDAGALVQQAAVPAAQPAALDGAPSAVPAAALTAALDDAPAAALDDAPAAVPAADLAPALAAEPSAAPAASAAAPRPLAISLEPVERCRCMTRADFCWECSECSGNPVCVDCAPKYLVTLGAEGSQKARRMGGLSRCLLGACRDSYDARDIHSLYKNLVRKD